MSQLSRSGRPPAALLTALFVALSLGCTSDGDDDDSDGGDPSSVRLANDRDYDDTALEAIENASERVHVVEYVIYDSGPVAGLLDAMVDAAGRGVDVRVLADEESADTAEALDDLAAGGVVTRLDSSQTTTHNKLIIADDRTLVGSHNFSTNAMTVNHEASVAISDAVVTDVYESIFQQLWEDSDREPEVAVDPDHWIVPLANRDIGPAVIDCIHWAEARVRLALYAMVYNDDYPDSDPCRAVDELIETHGRGVDVEVILDGSGWIVDNEINDAAIERLLAAGVEIRRTPSSVVTHAKMLLCDDTVVVGDANWSYSAFELYNGTSVRVTSAEIADEYLGYFEMLWTDSAAVE